jgi:hypothetical protein
MRPLPQVTRPFATKIMRHLRRSGTVTFATAEQGATPASLAVKRNELFWIATETLFVYRLQSFPFYKLLPPFRLRYCRGLSP